MELSEAVYKVEKIIKSDNGKINTVKAENFGWVIIIGYKESLVGVSSIFIANKKTGEILDATNERIEHFIYNHQKKNNLPTIINYLDDYIYRPILSLGNKISEPIYWILNKFIR